MFIKKQHSFSGLGRYNIITGFILFALFVAYYSVVLYLRIGTDVQVHADMSLQFFNGKGHITPNFLYYFLVALFAGFSKLKVAYYLSSVLLISLAISAKFLLNVYYLQKFTSVPPRIVTIGSIMLLFVFSLPGPSFFTEHHFYLGQIAPNVWHNSTVIFLAPFSIILFFETVDILSHNQPHWRQQLLVFSLILLNALIKPSFLFTIIPVVALYSIYRFIKSGYRVPWALMLPYVAGAVFIGIEYFIIYQLNTGQSVLSSNENSSVIFSPFEMWRHLTSNMPLAFLTSCFFPFIYILYTKGAVLKDRMVLVAGINFLIALLIWILFIETGMRRFHGNFYWQVVVGNYLLFFTMVLHLLQGIKNKAIPVNGGKMLAALFVIHSVWGVIYWAGILLLKGYS